MGLADFRSRVSGLRLRTAGFTLIEVLLVLALMALVGAVLFPAANALFPKTNVDNFDDIVSEVLQQARRDAVLGGREVTLRFDATQQRFLWDGAAHREQPWTGAKIGIDFLRPQSGNAVLIAGRLVETATVPALRFFPDGTCDPVRLQIRPASGNARVLSIDPWTCAPGLEVKG